LKKGTLRRIFFTVKEGKEGNMTRSQRKIQHIKHALMTGQSGKQGFEDVQFIPNSLPDISYVDTNLETSLQNLRLLSPIFINAMTGGAVQTTEINQKLAIIAREKGLAMAVGSQMAAVRDPSVADSYRVVRRENPDGILFANLGAEATLDQAKEAVDMLEANALQIHVNVMQELLMPEGDRDFRNYLRNIETLVSQIRVPLIVKEVGFGMGRKTIRQLQEAGVKMIDVGGTGGTNFAKVENMRNTKPLSMFESWGLTTVQSLLEASVSKEDDVSIIASGGMRDGLDAAKALAMGAAAVGMAGVFLQLVQTTSLDNCMEKVDELHHQLRIAMTALGVTTIDQLQHTSLIIAGETERWAYLREIDCRKFSFRGEENNMW
jgi:isopentenyl-diphosphate Delta-isomerase